MGGAVPFEMRVAKNYKAYAGDNISFWVIPGAWHVGGLAFEPEVHAHRMLEYFGAAIGTPEVQ